MDGDATPSPPYEDATPSPTYGDTTTSPVDGDAAGGRWRRALAVLVWTGAVLAPVCNLLAVRLRELSASTWADPFVTMDPTVVLFPAAGAFLVTRRPRLLVPWLLWGSGVIGGLYYLVYSGAHWLYLTDPGGLTPYLAWLGLWLWLWHVPVYISLLPLLFPDGRLPSWRWRPVLYANLILMAGHSLFLGLAPDPEFESQLPVANPFGVEALREISPAVESYIGAPMMALTALGVLSLAFRYRAGDTELRRQIGWYVAALVVVLVSWVLRVMTGSWLLIALEAVVIVVLPLSIIAAVLRYRLYGIDIVINRTLVYGSLVAVTGGVYFGLIWLANALASDLGSVAGAVAALAVGGVFHPARLRLQRVVDRMFAVERDPYRLADLLGRTGQGAQDPAAALGEVVAVIRGALGATGVGVEVRTGWGGPARVFRDGELRLGTQEVPLLWHAERVGTLLVAGAWPGREPLAVLARHLAELAHAVRLTADLHRSRERIRTTRDEERRRLGRELHDGLGPALTSVTLTLDEARRRLDTDPRAVEKLLVRVREEMTATIASVRELVYGLRPPALDDLGLEGALRASAGETAVTVDGALDDLPAAVEVAAYRIAQEALTNARRHAGPATVLIRLRRLPGELRVEVADDGVGLPESPAAGVGLTSMRERAAEVGGSCVIGRRPGGGTEVTARLPTEEAT
ncbi:Histidine kinase [Streptosporangium roseum DSM 43021]|uniref:Oxygen sensor histidine kinase NreB n=1 Tax=Streptosporangium roseum (strain ATCC 12428 / DSM 43021 / JCM 3005 / KCTC 9067 / NCIMB 10171 / NRRL 2505 / NI 9100) TaxID=479432 RepID=D2B2V1_STRRD|nr:Histidine kinase [Streptosporangium roseum DSM 43021]